METRVVEANGFEPSSIDVELLVKGLIN